MGTVTVRAETARRVRLRVNLQRDWPYLVAGAAPLILFAPFLFGLRVLYWGTPLLQFYPWRLAALAAVRGGELPLWNPWVGNGAPLLANYQTGVLYPPNWLSLVLPLDVSLGWLGALHLVLAAVGMVTLARSLGLKPLSQAIAGLAFGLSQYLVSRVGFLSINAAVAWLPWLVWAVDWQARLPAGVSARERLRPALALAGFTGLLLLAGHAQTAWYSLQIGGAWALWRLAGLGAGAARWRHRLATAGWLLAPLAIGVGLAAAQLLPTAELMRQSPRAERAEYEFVMTYSFSPWRLATLLAPDLLGNPARGRFYGYGNYWEDAVYGGVLPLLLAFSAAASGLFRRMRGRREPGPADGLPLLLVAIGLVCVVLGLGRNTPIFPFLYHNVPTFNLFQAPARMMVGLVFSLALLAGLGAERWQPLARRALYWTRLGTAGTVAIVMVGFGAVVALPAGTALGAQLRVVATAVGLTGVWLLASGTLSLLKGRLKPGVWAAAVVGVVALDLLYANVGLNPAAPRALYTQAASTSTALRAALVGQRLFIFPVEEQVVKFKRLLSFSTFGSEAQAFATRTAQLPNTAGLDGLTSANNFDPLVSARYQAVVDAAEATQSLALLRLMNVGVLASNAPRNLPIVVEAPDVGLRFYEVPGSGQRAWVVHQARHVAGPAESLAALADPGFDPATLVVLEGQSTEAGGRADVGPEPLRVTGTFNTLTIEAALLEPGWVVVPDTYYPGWEATVDGEPAEILPANHAFRAVAVGAGTHTVEFVYRPRSFFVGLAVSLLSAMVWVLAAARVRWRP